ncbi:MAG: hypothetical protein J5644_02810 [Bacteroidales bacterium]|nr:hypothetical protein [Bacteroidales bacterium]
MKKSLFLIPVIAVVILLTMTQCKKNYSCGLKVVCCFSETGVDTGKVVAGAALEIYPGAVAPGSEVHPVINQNRYDTTDENGSCMKTYPYEALLNITATYTDTTEHKDYRGTAQVKLQEGETVEKLILMMSGL